MRHGFTVCKRLQIASRLWMIARLHIEEGRIREAGFLPLYIGRDAVPRIVARDNEHFNEVVAYLRAITAEAGLNGRYRAEGDRVVIETAT
jgi:hypothetical protein